MKTGIIGLGAMGLPMAYNLHKAGHLHRVWNRTHEKAANFSAETGIPVAENLAAMASDCDLIITCVSADKDLLEVVSGLLSGITPGTILVDTSTVGIDTTKQTEKMLRDAGCAFLDAPVSGGVEGAKNGTLSMMVGGDADALLRVQQVLNCITKRIVHMGDSGSGQATKAVNQVMVAGINQAVTEALAFGEALGLDMDKLIDVIGGGAASNWFLTNRGPSMTKGIFDPGFKVSLHHKDLEICRNMAEKLTQSDNRLPIVEMTLVHYRRLMETGFGEEDISALYRQKQKLFETE